MTEKEKDLLEEIECYKNERAGLLRQIDELEKAFDKACKKIAEMDENLAKIIHGNDTLDYASVTEWKMWCLGYE